MFRVPTYLAPSSIHGVGVFTPIPIAARTILWEFTNGVDWSMAETDFSSFPEPYRTQLGHYCFVDDDGQYILCGDNARFMNHSDTPNCDDSGRITRTSRDIAAGEELTSDYRTFDRTSRLEPVLYGIVPHPAGRNGTRVPTTSR